MARAWVATVRASASKTRWLATVVAWFSMTRAEARVSTSWLRVTWAWPPGLVSHRSAGSMRAWAGAAAVRAAGVPVAGVVVWWVVRLQPETRRAVAARAPARRVSFMVSSGLWLPFRADRFSLGCGGSGTVRRNVAGRLRCKRLPARVCHGSESRQKTRNQSGQPHRWRRADTFGLAPAAVRSRPVRAL